MGMNFAITHRPGANLLLRDYPLLVEAPKQWGPGVRTEDRGVLVEDIAAKRAEIPDLALLADHFGTTFAHVAQALQYAFATGAIPDPPGA